MLFRRSLNFKLMGAFLLVSLAGIGLVALLAGVVTENRFTDLLRNQNRDALMIALVDYYDTFGSWDEVGEHARLPGSGPGQGRRGGPWRDDNLPGPPNAIRQEFVLTDVNGIVIWSANRNDIGKPATRRQLDRGTELELNGETIGILVDNRPVVPTTPEASFIREVKRSVVIGAVAAALLSLLLGFVLARTLIRPIRALTVAAQSVASGDLDQRVDVRSRDELGELAHAFNQMSYDLAQSRDIRRQMTADIAHDLRTPLSIILGHAEALSDGVLPANSDTFYIIHDEAERLNRLVDDLRTLSLTEAGELTLVRQSLTPTALLDRVANAYRSRADSRQIKLEMEAAPNLPQIHVDPDRIGQVLDNLVSNAMRYTPEGGSIRLQASNGGDQVRLSVQDTGPGMPPEQLKHIFERFYRGDKSRTRHEGGSGLGLAIARSLVEAHGGQIHAENASPTGLRMTLTLPVV